MTTPTNLYFFAEFYKKGPAGSEKQVINLVWPYGFSHRTLKWWRRAFFHLIEVAIVNAYIMHASHDTM